MFEETSEDIAEMAGMAAQENDFNHNDLEQREVERKIDFKLSDEEVAHFARMAAEKETEISLERLKFEAVKAEWKAKLKEKEDIRLDLMSMVRSGFQSRKVVCTEQLDYRSNTAIYVFDGKIVEERVLTIEERQRQLEIAQKDFSPVRIADRNDQPAQSSGHELRDVIRDETRASTKHSSVDGPAY